MNASGEIVKNETLTGPIHQWRAERPERYDFDPSEH
jgi:hypothetical protein